MTVPKVGTLTRTRRSLRALMRVEMRELRRNLRRSILMLSLVAVPVAAVVGGGTLGKITEPTHSERKSSGFGRADFSVERPREYADLKRLLALLPGDAEVGEMRLSAGHVSVPGRSLIAKEYVLGDNPGLVDGMFQVDEGRLPSNSGEAALSLGLLQGLSLAVGDQVLLDFGGYRTVTGIVSEPEVLSRPIFVRTRATVEHRGQGFLLVRDPAGPQAKVVDELRNAGFAVELRSEMGSGGEAAWVVFVLGVIGFFEAALVMAAGFSVGLRRRQVEMGLLGSAGAAPGALVAALLGSASVLALLGGAIGTLTGILGSAALHPFLDGWNNRLNGPFEVSWGAVLGGTSVGLVTALLATLIPAWLAAGMPIRVALGGRTPSRGPGRALGWAGLAVVALGLTLLLLGPRNPPFLGTLSVIGGSILGVLGFGIASPALLGLLASLATRLPVAWRLAVRDAGRFRGRNGPVVTAVLAGMSMSVTVAVLTASLEQVFERLPQNYRSDQLMLAGPGSEGAAEQLAESLAAVAVSPLQAAYRNGEPIRAVEFDRDDDGAVEEDDGGALREWVAVGGSDLFLALGVSKEESQRIEGQLVRLGAAETGWREILNPGRQTARPRDVRLETWRDGSPLRGLELADVAVSEAVMSPMFVVHESLAAARGWHVGPPLDRSVTPWLLRLAQEVTPQVVRQARELVSDGPGVTLDAQLLHSRPTRGVYVVVQLLCILTGLVIVLVATTLSNVESATDEQVLHSVGASPQVLRSSRAARAGYLALLGCVLALPAGLIPAIGLFQSSNLSLEPVVPWLDLIVAALGLPLLAYALTWMAHRRRDILELRRRAALGVVLVGVVLFPRPSEALEEREEGILWVRYEGEGMDGSPLMGQLGRLSVASRSSDPSSNSIRLSFVRYRTTHPDPGPPVFFLAGGPGGSSVELSAVVATHPQMRFLEQTDVIGIDQRGIGLSEPNLEETPGARVSLPYDEVVSRETYVEALARSARTVWSYWQNRGVDLRDYNSREAADDIEAVRKALGLEKIRLYGASYGTHLALAYLKRYPDRVESALLVRVEGPNHTWKLPATLQRQLEELHQRCLGTPTCMEMVPDVLTSTEQLLDRLKRNPVRVLVPPQEPVEGELVGGLPNGSEVRPSSVTIGAHDLKTFLANSFSFSTLAAEIPMHLRDFSGEEWGGLVETALELRRPEILAMPWATDCASGATAERLEIIRRQAASPKMILSDAIQGPHFPEVCVPCRGCDLGDDFRRSFESEVPVMFVSGLDDVRTPAANVHELEGGFSRASHVEIENAGHESRELMSREYRALFQAFLRGEDVPSTRISLPVPLFLTEVEEDP